MPERTTPRSAAPRRLGLAPRAVILAALALQTVAALRILCPPCALAAARRARIACAPALWPFLDYPMYAEPHRRGDSIAWVEVRLGESVRAPRSGDERPACHEVRRAAPGETWDDAFRAVEERVRAELATHGAAHARAAVLERHRLVLTERGFVVAAVPEREERRP